MFQGLRFWLRRKDLNQRPSGYEHAKKKSKSQGKQGKNRGKCRFVTTRCRRQHKCRQKQTCSVLSKQVSSKGKFTLQGILGNSCGKLKKAKSGRTTTQNSGQKSRFPKFPMFFGDARIAIRQSRIRGSAGRRSEHADILMR